MLLYSDFIRDHKIFDPHAMSKGLRESMIPTLQGLGLPTPAYARVAPWGYEKQGDVYYPIERDLLILLTAQEMKATKQYHESDIFNWMVSAAPSKMFERRTWFYMKEKRPLFPELRLPFEERVNLVYRLTPATT